MVIGSAPKLYVPQRLINSNAIMTKVASEIAAW